MNNNMPPMIPTVVADQARFIWCMRLQSAFRAAFACAIIGAATFYFPNILVNQARFTAFSYLTAVVIMFDAPVFGDTLRGCWHVICASAQVVPFAMLARWMIDPEVRLPIGMASLITAAASFLVALPECTHLNAKRIAFGQIVLVCTDAVMTTSDDSTSASFMHPLHIALSTALGALASVIALLLPCPALAYNKARKLCRLYAENASERVNLYLRAFSAQDNQTKLELISQARSIAETGGVKFLPAIRILQERMCWERPWSRCSKPDFVNLGDRLQSLELPMRGIEYSLVSSTAFPVQVVDQEHLSNVLHALSVQIQLKFEQAKTFPPFDAMTPEIRGEFREKPLLPLEPIFPVPKFEWVFFFFSCVEMLINNKLDTRVESSEIQTQGIISTFTNWIKKLISYERLEFAFKCSISLGLATLFGLLFDKENGRWAGLTIAISFVTKKQAVFTIANTRAQGTAIGSVYGVICCFLFQYEELRLLALLPWIIIASLLGNSRIYGKTGAVGAAIGALLILGRKNYGAPDEFAIARLTEVFIGLSTFVMTELFMQPTRAATLANSQMYLTLRSLQDCIKQAGFYFGQKNQPVSNFLELKERQRKLEHHVCELKRFVADAESEPDFWYMPFRASCYQKLVGSLSNVVNMLYFITHNLEKLSELPESSCTVRNEFLEQMNSEWDLFQEMLSSSLRYIEKTDSIESQAVSQESMYGNLEDLEVGKLENLENLNVLITEDTKGERITEGEEDSVSQKDLRERIVQCMSAMRFCISFLRKEIDETKINLKEIVQWERHSSQKKIQG